MVKRRILFPLVALMMAGLMASCSSYGPLSSGHQCEGRKVSNHR